MRAECGPKDFDIDLADFGKHFSPGADAFGMKWRRAQSAHRFELRPRLGRSALSLYRHQRRELACLIPQISSSHADNQAIADFYNIPYVIVAVAKDNQIEAGANNSGTDRRATTRTSWCSRGACKFFPTTSSTSTQSRSSTFTTRSCRRSGALGHTTRHSSAA
jgi:hypothetical protein